MATDLDVTMEYAAYLLELPTEDRAAAGKALNMALDAATPDEDIGKAPVRTLGEYLDSPVEVPPILVEPGLVAVGAISALVSRGGKGKTAVSLNRLLKWAMGKPLFDELADVMKPVRPLKILIIENEGNGGHFQKILGTILNYEDEDGASFTDEERELARENVHIWGDGGWSGLKIDRDEDFALVKRAVEQTGVDIVFIEPFRGLWQGNENDATEMGVVCDAMSEIANTYSCAVMLTHHENKSASEAGADPMNAFRGSTVLEGAAAVMERWVPVKGARERELSCVKNRFDEEYTPFRLSFNRAAWGYRFVPENETLRNVKGVLVRMGGAEITVADIAADLQEREANVRRWLKALVEEDAQIKMRPGQKGAAATYRYTGDTNDNSGGGIGV